MSNFEIVDKKAEVDTCYGLESFYITSEEINALLSGKKLYSSINCGEYAITIEMEEAIDPNTYICDPEKNTDCKKTHCQTLCFRTTDPRYRKEDK